MKCVFCVGVVFLFLQGRPPGRNVLYGEILARERPELPRFTHLMVHLARASPQTTRLLEELPGFRLVIWAAAACRVYKIVLFQKTIRVPPPTTTKKKEMNEMKEAQI